MEKKPPSKPMDLTIRLLEQIRLQIAGLDDKLTERVDHLTERVDHLTSRVDGLDATMRELAEQQRFIVRGVRTLGQRDARFEKELAALRARLP